MSADTFRLELNHITKSFPGVRALDDVTVQIRPGEVHALVGENGAGKSTLIKILSGAYQKDSGQIVLDGHNVEISTPAQALDLGIVTIYQETNLCPDLTVAENVFLGRLPRKGPFVNRKQLFVDAQIYLDHLNAPFRAQDMVGNLSTAQRQMVEVARALSLEAQVIVFDEPSASLTDSEVQTLFKIIGELRARGVSIIYISHRLSEVIALSDRITVLRDGSWIITSDTRDMSEAAIVRHMVGRNLRDLYRRRSARSGDQTRLQVNHLTGPGFNDVSFELAAGEILGLFGLVGSGRTAVVRAIFGAETLSSGSIAVDSIEISIRSPRAAIEAGIVLAPEDRKSEGLVLGMSVKGNITLPNLQEISTSGIIQQTREAALAEKFRENLDIRCPSVKVPAESLSGGNQQKVVLAKWLAQKPKVLIVDEPTRGIDVAGKSEVHKLMDELAQQGVSILMVSSDLPEVIGMSDRILIMHEKRLVGEVMREQATEELIMSYATGQLNPIAA